MQRHLTVMACASLLTLAACGSDGAADDPPSNQPADQSTSLPTAHASDDVTTPTAATEPDAPELAALLANRVFLSSRVDGHTLVDGTQIRIAFPNDSINANAGCNTLGATATYDRSTLVVGQIEQTEIGCEPELEQQDVWLRELLKSRPTLVLDGDTLTITSGNTTITLLDRVVAEPDAPLVGTTWVVDGLVTGDAVSSVPVNSNASITISDDSASVHTGCNRGSASVEVTADTITFGPMATTKMACESELMDLEAAVTSVLVGEVDYSVEAGQLTISTEDADGQTIGLILTVE